MTPAQQRRATRAAIRDLEDAAGQHAAFTRRLMPPRVEPWRDYWREAAIDLQRALDRALAELRAERAR